MERQRASPDLAGKEKRLREILRQLPGALVAFSGGVDSSVLLAIAAQELGDRVLAVTAVSPLYPRREIELARQTARQLGVRHVEVQIDHLAEIPGFSENPPERCYICKRHIFSRLRQMAEAEGMILCHGAQADDMAEDRPGQRAAEEIGARAPLAEAGLTKADVRQIARRLGLPSADLPAMACLATRFPFNTHLNWQEIEKIGRAEEFLADLRFSNYRARWHGDLVRIEVPEDEIARFTDAGLRRKVVEFMRSLGFKRVTLDLQGYRTGGAA